MLFSTSVVGKFIDWRDILGNRNPRLPSTTGMFTYKEERRDILRSMKIYPNLKYTTEKKHTEKLDRN